jgi:macrocin-O-methyltransferase TylF-like protien
MPGEEIEIPPRSIRAVGPRADQESLRRSYLDLLKLALCDLLGAGTRTISWTGDRRVFSRELEGDDQLQWRADGRDWPLNALTMVGLRRLDDLQSCVETVVANGVQGDLVEAGAWRGGASILMRATLDSLGAHERTVWVADSFQGFPAPEAHGDPEDTALEQEMNAALDYLSASLETVGEHFARFGCAEGVRFVPGFFEDTMPQLHGKRWSVIRLDADSYKATRLTLETLYPGLAVGGYVVLDDYCFLPASRRAVDEFRREHGIGEPIEEIDWNGARWRRESDAPIPPPETGAVRGDSPREPAQRSGEPIPTARELELGDELRALRARLETLEAELDQLRSSPVAGPLHWARRKTGRRV